ncbi:DUF7284 family protein [Methanococcoides sp. FTZ1]|uniref:DUF7284 family protein n=1 Tax=Methanococcoides sp. FTZ1 TaxID=3439061 RepID=UPI003F847F46
MLKTKFTQDQRAFSTTLDALFFLVLISVATAIIMPSITAERQYDAAAYTATQDFNTHLLSSLLNSNVDRFEYEITPLEITGITIPENSFLSNPMNTMFGKQHQHRTFADMIAEDMLLTLTIEQNGSSRYINPIAQDHKRQTSQAIASYLDTRIGGRYEYHLEANWEPVQNYPLKSSLAIGMTPPYDTVRQSSRITLPLNQRTSRDELIAIINDSLLQDINNSSNTTKLNAYDSAFNRTIEEASLSAAETITEIVFPAEYLRNMIGQYSENPIDTFGASPQEDTDNIEILIATHILNYSSGIAYEEDPIHEELDNNIISVLEQKITEYNQQRIEEHLHNELDINIDNTSSKMANSTDINTTKELRDAQVDEIYRMIDNYYVDVTISIW